MGENIWGFPYTIKDYYEIISITKNQREGGAPGRAEHRWPGAPKAAAPARVDPPCPSSAEVRPAEWTTSERTTS